MAETAPNAGGPGSGDGWHRPSRLSFAPSGQSSLWQSRPAPHIPDHELLRSIGRGSYGEVWLARSVLGTLRAVKVVHRDSFDADRPYDREFAGIQRFEPISRADDSQLDILQVGRNDAAGYFYYVMELADDAAEDRHDRPPGIRGSSDPGTGARADGPASTAPAVDAEIASYTPRTLKLELQRRSRLPVEECLRAGIALASALDYLHRHGLIHRDIKLSNIVFIRDAPKLADIGLVTAADATCSFVGTEGYFPPEGPGSLQADLYGLGKVIYEIATGRDRRDFPEIPRDWASPEEEKAFLELNSVILKACKRDPRQRYGSAAQLRADLLLLQSGKSVRRTHFLEERLVTFSRAAALLLGISVLAIAAYLWSSLQTEQVRAHLSRAENAEGVLREQLRESLLHQARALRLSGRPGQRAEALESLSRAAAIRPGADLRTEAVHCLGLTDLHRVRRWTSGPGDESVVVPNLRLDRVAHSNRRGDIVIRSLTDDHELARLPGSGTASMSSRSSRSGLYHAAEYHPADRPDLSRWIIWDIARQEPAFELPPGIQPMTLTFHPNERTIIAGTKTGDLLTFDLATGRESVRATLGLEPYAFSLNPDGSLLAVSGLNGEVQIRAVADRQLLKTFEHPAGARIVGWHPDGRRLAVPCDDWMIYLWDLETERRLGVFAGHLGQVVGARFSHDGHRLASVSWDKSIGLWDVERLQLLVRTPVTGGTRFLEFSPDDRRLARYGDNVEAEILEITSPARIFQGTGIRDRSMVMADVSPDDELIAYTSPRGLHLRWFGHLTPASELNALRGRSRAVRFLSTNRIIFGGAGGLFVANVHRSVAGNANASTAVGPTANPGADDGSLWLKNVTALWTNRFPEGSDDFALTQDERRLITRADTNAAAIMDMTGAGVPLFLQPHPELSYVALSADGHWAATGSSREGSVRLWDGSAGTLLKVMSNAGPARVLFSADAKRLIVAAPEAVSIVETGTWLELQRIPRDGAEWRDRIPAVVLSPDGALAALRWTADIIQLIHLARGERLLTLEALGQGPLCFSADGSRIYVLGQFGEVYFWELEDIRQNLDRLGLGWEGAPDRQRQAVDAKPKQASRQTNQERKYFQN